ncbi:hypothetical protein AC1031_012383 [Aphanomyces cochlioides]|nr:hypothetical protein AC1031_012383 [Aphanomyces cochlioides]
MRVLLFVVFAMSVVGWSHPLDRRPARVRQAANRFLKGKFERMGTHYGAKNGETIGGGAGNALGQLGSAVLGTLTGGNVGTKAGRSGLGVAGRITGEYAGASCLGSLCGAAGRQIDKLTKSGRQAQAAAKNAKKQQAEALKKPVLYSGGDYQKAKLSRTGSSPALLQRNKASTNGASTSGSKSPINKGKSPINVGKASTSGASTSGTKPTTSGSKALTSGSPRHGASTSTAKTSPSRATTGQAEKRPGILSRAKESAKTTLRNAVAPKANKMFGSNAKAPRPPPAGRSGGSQAVSPVNVVNSCILSRVVLSSRRLSKPDRQASSSSFKQRRSVLWLARRQVARRKVANASWEELQHVITQTGTTRAVFHLRFGMHPCVFQGWTVGRDKVQGRPQNETSGEN